MSQISRLPTGLQSLLQSKNFGRNPDQLLQEVRPTLDLEQFWQAYVFHSRTSGETNLNNGQEAFFTFTVPAGEYWLVTSVGIVTRVTAGGNVGDGASFSAAIDDVVNSDSPVVPVGLAGPWPYYIHVAGVSLRVHHVTHFDRPVPLRSNEKIQFNAGDFVQAGAPTIAVRCNVRFLRFTV